MRLFLSVCFLFIWSTSAYSSIILAINKPNPDISHWAVSWDCNPNSTLYTGILAKNTVKNFGYTTAYTRPQFPYGYLTNGVMTVIQLTNSDNQVAIGLGADASSYTAARVAAIQNILTYQSSSFKSTDTTTTILERSFSCNAAEPEFTSGGIFTASTGETTTPIDTGTTTPTPTGSSGSLINVDPLVCMQNTIEPIKIDQQSGGNALIIVTRGGAEESITVNKRYYLENGTCEPLTVQATRYVIPGPETNLKWLTANGFIDETAVNNISGSLQEQWLADTTNYKSEGYLTISLSETESSVSQYADGCHKIDYVINASTPSGVSRAVNTFVGFCIGSDFDGDGTIDPLDNDMDNDGVVNEADALPRNSNETKDFDMDGIGDNADTDDDNDGWSDIVEGTYGTDPFKFDTDGDGVGDKDDDFPLNATESLDTDGDGIGNNADMDDDGDGENDSIDAFPLDATESVDTDGDGTGDNSDAFPDDAAESMDTDGDGLGDNADAFPLDKTESVDGDGDGVGDNADAFPKDASESVDTDGDGTGDNSDPFPQDKTENLDTDGDGIGNNTDTDDDNDGLPDHVELSNGLSPTDPSDAEGDIDSDGQSNIIEYSLGTDMSDANSVPVNGLGTGYITEGFESDGSSNLSWTHTGSAKWTLSNTRSHTGGFSAKAPNTLTDRQEAYFSTTLNVIEGEISFWHESWSADALLFYIDGIYAEQWTTQHAWESSSFPVSAGTHTFTWKISHWGNTPTDSWKATSIDDIQFPVNSDDNDNDGVSNTVDAFPTDPNERFDTDSDGIGNNADTDDDNDGLIDSLDPNPLDISGLVITDSDNDGVVDAADAFPLDATESVDTDGDGTGDNSDAFPDDATESIDTDGDGTGNNTDPDDDGDGVADTEDAFPLDETKSVAENTPPIARLSVEQNTHKTRILMVDDGIVTMRAIIKDPDHNEQHTVVWTNTDNTLVDTDDTDQLFTFDPSWLADGIYTVNLKVTDNSGESVAVESLIKIISTHPLLTSADTDQDGTNDMMEGGYDSDEDGIPNYLDKSSDSNHMQSSVNSDVELRLDLVQARIVIGDRAFADEASGVLIDENALINSTDGAYQSDNLYHVEKIYNYNVENLNKAGDSQSVTIPLTEPLAQNVILRNYSNHNGWHDFVTDSYNSIISAAKGADGICQDNGTKGLVEGVSCIIVLIQDGGPNDEDSKTNGIIKYTGALSIPASVLDPVEPKEESASEGSGGSVNNLFLLIMLFFYFAGRFRNNTQTTHLITRN